MSDTDKLLAFLRALPQGADSSLVEVVRRHLTWDESLGTEDPSLEESMRALGFVQAESKWQSHATCDCHYYRNWTEATKFAGHGVEIVITVSTVPTYSVEIEGLP